MWLPSGLQSREAPFVCPASLRALPCHPGPNIEGCCAPWPPSTVRFISHPSFSNKGCCARVVLLPLLPEALNAAVPARHDACCTEGLAVNLRWTRRCFASIVIIFLFAWPTSLADCGRGRLFFGAQSHSGIAASPLRAPRCFGEAICALWEVNGLPA